MSCLLVGIGGFLGGISRFGISGLIRKHSGSAAAAGTFFVNITGAVLLGMLVGGGTSESAYSLLGDGFCGAYTTFSTLMYEDYGMLSAGRKTSAAIYITLTLLLGVAGYACGMLIAG